MVTARALPFKDLTRRVKDLIDNGQNCENARGLPFKDLTTEKGHRFD